MRIIVRAKALPVPIPVLLPSALIFNHVSAVTVLLVMLTLQLCGRTPWKKLPHIGNPAPFAIFRMYSRLIFVYWRCRITIPGWKLAIISSSDADISIKL